jgi:phenylacetate-CoA ligase
MLDQHAVIALPRYASGDLGRLVSHQDAALAAQLAATPAPWLPVVVVKGRIKDRPAGLPSVESIKELIYSEPTVADQLTGAFRIAKAAGGVKLVIQVNHDRAIQYPGLHQHLVALGSTHLSVPFELELLAPLAFPYRPVLDHERKFPYLAPSDP